MEGEKIADAGNDKAPPSDSNGTQDVVGDLINEAKEKADLHANGTNDTVMEGLSPKQDAEHPKSPVPPISENKPSERVREGQKWNDRPRNFDNKGDGKPYKYDNKQSRGQYRKNIKSNFESQEESSDPIAIRKQVEFYFSDSNLLQDKFLFEKVQGHQNLPVPIEVIHSFRRMRHFQPVSAVVNALKESSTLDVVEDDTCIQRKEALPEGLVGKPMVEIKKVHEDKTMARSIYAKGFGKEGPSTQFDIEAFFAKYGPTNSVRLRRVYPEQVFKGSVFVEFDTEETQKSFLALEPKPKWEGKELDIKSKKQYCDMKVADIKAGKVRPNGSRDDPDDDQDEPGADKDDRDWRTRREEDQKSGFRGRNGGKHRGFGSSGRGGRGGRGGRSNRGHRDRNGERNDRDQRGVPKIQATSSESGNQSNVTTSNDTDSIKQEQTQLEPPIKQEQTPSEPSIKQEQTPSESHGDALNGEKSTDTSTAPVATTGTVIEQAEPTNGESKKRGRDEDDVAEGQGNAKKVDTKDGGS